MTLVEKPARQHNGTYVSWDSLGLLPSRLRTWQSVAIERPCSKVLLVDDTGRVLLFSGIDRTKPDAPPIWFAVGGTLEPGETPREAAIRETREETGLVIVDPGPVAFSRRFSWDFEGQDYDQEEWFFLVRTPRFDRWWSIEELRATTEKVFPEDLPDELEHLLAD